MTRALTLLLCLTSFFWASPGSSEDIFVGGSDWALEMPAGQIDGMFSRSQTFVKIPLYPKRLVAVESDAFDPATGKKVLSAGDQLIPHLTASSQRDFCTTRDLGFLNKGIFHCFVDQDEDGQLDGYYRILSRLLSGAPLVDSGKVEQFKRLSPTSIRDIDPHTLDNPMALRVKWQRGDGIKSPIEASLSLVSSGGSTLHLQGVTTFKRSGQVHFGNVVGMRISCRPVPSQPSPCAITFPGFSLQMTHYGSRLSFVPFKD